MFSELLDTLSRIAINHADVVAPIVAVVLLLVANRVWGGWPDLWRVRRAVLPLLADVGDGEYAELDERIEQVDLEETVPEKTRLALLDRECAGVIDAPPAVVRRELREMERVWPCNLASIQFDVDESGERVYEVGSYAFRAQGWLGEWQIHVRLTPADGGRRTRLWAHREKSAWRRPVAHYRSEGWDADEGIYWVATMYRADERYQPSDRAIDVIHELGETPSDAE